MSCRRILFRFSLLHGNSTLSTSCFHRLRYLTTKTNKQQAAAAAESASTTTTTINNDTTSSKPISADFDITQDDINNNNNNNNSSNNNSNTTNEQENEMDIPEDDSNIDYTDAIKNVDGSPIKISSLLKLYEGGEHANTSSPFRYGSQTIGHHLVFATSQYSFAMVHSKPIAPGHVLIVPKNRKAHRVSDLSFEELSDLMNLAKDVSVILEKEYKVSSFTFAIQDGIYAGQIINHIHIDVIPRKPNEDSNYGINNNIYNRLEQDSIMKHKSLLSINNSYDNEITDKDTKDGKKILLTEKQLEFESWRYGKMIRWFRHKGYIKKVIPYEDTRNMHWLRDLYYEKYEYSPQKKFIQWCMLVAAVTLTSAFVGTYKRRQLLKYG